jgi:hypothetical protein
MGNDQPALRALLACESGLSEPEIGLEHMRVRSFDLAKEARQMEKFARCPKTTASRCNSFCHFHLISCVSLPQGPLIVENVLFFGRALLLNDLLGIFITGIGLYTP